MLQARQCIDCIKDFYDHPTVDRLISFVIVIVAAVVNWLVEAKDTITILIMLLILAVRLAREIKLYRRGQ